jgi:hypothetical protein
MKCWLLLSIVLAACGGGGARRPTTSHVVRPELKTAGDRILPLLPDGAQVVIELDLKRLRANAVIGALVTQALTGPAIPGVPADATLAHADVLVMASYGLGTSNAATVTVLVTPDTVPHSVSLGDGVVALGPEEWTAQLEARAAINRTKPLLAAKELLSLRDHAMPAGAPGASLRITANLPFDARVALARQTGIEAPPARISIWGDVVDDLAVIVDADAADKGDAKAGARLEAAVRGLLAGLAGEPSVRAVGIPNSIEGAKIVAQGTWVRTIIAIGPAHLARAVARAKQLLEGTS